MTFLGVSFVAPCVYLFSILWLKLLRDQRRLMYLSLIVAACFYFIGAHTSLFFPRVRDYYWGYYPYYSILSATFLIFFFAVFFGAFYNFIQAYKGETNTNKRKQIKLIAIAFLISFTGSIDFIPKLFQISIYPIGYICVFAWIMTVAYSIVKYRVMDIETVIHQTILWLVTSSVVVLPIIAIFYFLKEWYSRVDAFAFSLCTSFIFFCFFFYLKNVQPQIDHIFKRREFDLKQVLLSFNEKLVHLQGLFDLSGYVENTIRSVLYSENVSIFIKDLESNEFLRLDKSGFHPSDVIRKSAFISWLEKWDYITHSEYLDLDPRYADIASEGRQFFEERHADLIVPLVLNNELLGFVEVGRKTNLKPFRSAEIKFLSELRRPVTIAFSNSLRLVAMQDSYKRWNEQLELKVKQRTAELEEAQKQLVQAEKLATIGTLAGGVAHEINNPLAAVLTNAQLLKMSIQSKDDLESIDLIEEGAKRCQQIVQKLMNYSRKQTEDKFEKNINLNDVINNVLNFIKYQLDQENIQISKKLKSECLVKGNSNELEQVFTNLILNAKDAIRNVRQSGSIEIETYENNGCVHAVVSDNGSGISTENINKIFDPFFTTKEVGKGTGLGLSITFSIIQKHNGEIKVTSKKGEGSKFLITIPKIKSSANL